NEGSSHYPGGTELVEVIGKRSAQNRIGQPASPPTSASSTTKGQSISSPLGTNSLLSPRTTLHRYEAQSQASGNQNLQPYPLRHIFMSAWNLLNWHKRC